MAIEEHGTSGLITAALIGAAAVVGAVLKPLFDFLKGRKNGNGNHLDSKIHDMHRWLSPNQDGIQSWRGHEIKSAIDQTRTSQETHFQKLHESNSRAEQALQEQTRIIKEGLEKVVAAVKEKG